MVTLSGGFDPRYHALMMRSKSSSAKDPIATWMASLEDHREDLQMRFGHLAPGFTEPEWFELPHARFDGFGGLEILLDRKGFSYERPDPLALRSSASVRKGPLGIAISNLQRTDGWRCLRDVEGSRMASTLQAAETAGAWGVLTPDETSHLHRLAARARASVNAHLLHTLQKAIGPWVRTEWGQSVWMMPVNLRGALTLPRHSANHISFLRVRVAFGDRSIAVHRRIQRALAAGEHWTSWRLLRWGSQSPRRIRSLVITWLENSPAPFVGIFSHLGTWRGFGPSGTEDDSWLCAPPPIRFAPLGAATIEWNGRLAMMIMAHPSLTRDEALVKTWLHLWQHEALSQTQPPHFGMPHAYDRSASTGGLR